MEFVRIPAGEFMMGSPRREEGWEDRQGPQHRVRINKAFYMAATEVTNDQYDQFVRDSGYDGRQDADGNYLRHHRDWRKHASTGEKYPVVAVSWKNAQAFCAWLSRKTGRTVRLPTEAEWEYACRAGTTTPFHFGDTISTDQANYNGKQYGSGQKGESRNKTMPAGSFAPNPWGLYDMHGNVWERCNDWYGEAYYRGSPQEDPPGPTSGKFRVLRGGSRGSGPVLCRSAARIGAVASRTSHIYGFRVIVVPRQNDAGVEASSGQTPATLRVDSGFASIAGFREGAKAYANRNYKWQNVPANTPFSRFARVDGGGKTTVVAEVLQSGIVYIAIGSGVDMSDAGWQRTPLALHYTDRGRARMSVWKKWVDVGPFELKGRTWSGPVLLLSDSDSAGKVPRG